ncbi:NAD(P)/FAD-dependent oxidoreductase [Promicromonospora citrea]|uniref:Pyridine nucleotide-disulfide oxidoreductase n=1 Tax=Promicromonospora citrea TaxID=43677 RepID=A0A8H9L3B5_9MICO|nr:FAD-dependent oxidoreductase [Promicromonospora citrea]NNH51952.1 FAD-dependent oxidoreductase [Promicromonospora citrea]GGM19810.1 pyridine nucleotide-disulfide oxidoreductase [Promicromonospora citrea]
MEPFVLVGGGLTTARAAEALREEGYDGDLVVVTAEPHRPYERPPLSKDYLRGEAERDAVFPLDEGWYAEHDVDVRTGETVVGLDAAEHRLTLSDGATLTYAKTLLAPGSAPRTLAVPGADLAGVHYLRTIEDADRISSALLEASLEGVGRLVVIGDGWIGLEVAASARTLGLDVTVVGRGDHPLGRVLGPEMSDFYAGVHAEHDVRLVRGATVVGLDGADGRVTGVRLADGTRLPADGVVIGIGATPNIGLAESAGLELRDTAHGGGIAVDATLASSHPDVFAGGDVASIPSERYGRPLRVEHWATAQHTGAHAGRAMLGATDPYDRLPYFYSDQYDVGMEYTGWVDVAAGYDDVVVSGDLDAREVVAFWRVDGRVAAGMAVNVWDQMERVEELIRSGREVSAEELRRFVG